LCNSEFRSQLSLVMHMSGVHPEESSSSSTPFAGESSRMGKSQEAVNTEYEEEFREEESDDDEEDLAKTDDNDTDWVLVEVIIKWIME
jgi:hypothetical protein